MTKLDLGIDLSKRILDNQLSSIDQLQTKVGVLLGFDATILGVVFTFGRSWAVAHIIPAGISGVLLFGAAVILGWTLRDEDYLEAPDPKKFVAEINNPAVTPPQLQDWAIGRLLGAFLANFQLIRRRFGMVNKAIILMLAGLGVFLVGAFLP